MIINKKASLNKHAKKRAEERFHVKLNREDLYNLSSAIRNNSGVKFEKSISNRVTAWKVTVPKSDEQALALYDKKRKTVITFLPLDYAI